MPSPAKPVGGFSLPPLSGLRQQPEYLIRRQRLHPEHQVRHHLRISPDPDMRTHSSVRITCSSFGVMTPTSFRRAGISSR